MADLGRIHFLCQRCQQPLRLDSSLFSMDEHTMAQLSLPISPAPEVDLASQAASLDRLVLPTKLTESGGINESRDRGGNVNLNFFCRYDWRFHLGRRLWPSCIALPQGEGPHQDQFLLADQVRVTSQLFDLLSDNSSVDHPLCGECTDSLLQV